MSKKLMTDGEPSPSDSQQERNKVSNASIAWAITTGVIFGAVIGGLVGISLRPKQDLTELSHEWLEEFKDVTDRVSGRVRQQLRELVSKRVERSEGYEEYPESYV
jgi:Na+/glutamate symporter